MLATGLIPRLAGRAGMAAPPLVSVDRPAWVLREGTYDAARIGGRAGQTLRLV